MDFDDIFGGEAEEGNGEQDQSLDMFMFTGMNQEEVNQYREQKDSVIFLVDCHSSMFRQNQFNQGAEHDSSSVNCVLKAALSFMKNKIITNESDKIGIVLYGCTKT
jgi:hemerythrin superfamily protein